MLKGQSTVVDSSIPQKMGIGTRATFSTHFWYMHVSPTTQNIWLFLIIITYEAEKVYGTWKMSCLVKWKSCDTRLAGAYLSCLSTLTLTHLELLFIYISITLALLSLLRSLQILLIRCFPKHEGWHLINWQAKYDK